MKSRLRWMARAVCVTAMAMMMWPGVRAARQAAPDTKIAESDPKDKLVAMMKDSFAFCSTALANVDDSKLGEQLMLFGNRPISRGGALVALGGSWTDHYATEAIYLRLNGILPPTAQPPKQ